MRIAVFASFSELLAAFSFVANDSYALGCNCKRILSRHWSRQAIAILISIVASSHLAIAQDIEPVLALGTNDGPAVNLLKSLLTHKLDLDPPMPLDGKFDEATKVNVIEFQEALSPNATGTVDARTWQALFDIQLNSNVKVSVQGMKTLREILDAAELKTARITSGVRTATDQARIMYDNIKTHSVEHQKKLYGSVGDQVIDVYVANASETEDDVKKLMQEKIEELGPEKVSKHCSNTHDVIDVAPSSISNRSKFEAAILKAKDQGAISKYIMPPGDPAYHLEIPKAVAPVDEDLFKVKQGQLTFDAEGQEGGPFHSRKPHVPGATSGVTIGRGYDLKERTKAGVVKDLVAAGLAEAEAKKYADGVGKVGNEAKTFIAQSNLVEITPRQQKRLFEIVYAEMEKDVRRICDKKDVVAKYGATDWTGLHPKIKDLLIDLRYRGDYTSSSREFLQSLVVKNDLPAFGAEIAKVSNWTSVPPDRFQRRVDYLAVPTVDMSTVGNEVQQLQIALNRLLVPSPKLAEDGIFGPNTTAALKVFQTQVGVPVTGVLDDATRKKLNRPVIKAGDTGADVTYLQESLNRIAGAGTVTVNGTFDPATAVAVKAFQQKCKLKVDGVVGKDTWSALASTLSLPTATLDPIKEILEISSQYAPAQGTDEWTTLDLAKWRTPVVGDDKLIFDFKKQWCVGYIDTIRAAAKKYKLPPILVAGVAYNEVGGDPLWADDAGYIARSNEVGKWLLKQLGKSGDQDRTSFGNVSIQLRRAAETLGIDPATITPEQERDLINLLKNPTANIFVASKHLQVLAEIAISTPLPQTMSDEQIELLGALYTSFPSDKTIQDFKNDPMKIKKAAEDKSKADPYIVKRESRKTVLEQILTGAGHDPKVLTGEAIILHYRGLPADFQGADIGVLLVGDKGLTKYYEFGRYAPQPVDGLVRNRIIPNVKIVGNEADKESLTNVLNRLSEDKKNEAGQPQPPEIKRAYFRFMSFSHMHTFALEAQAKSDPSSPKFDPQRKKFSAANYNSAHFAEEVVYAGNPKVSRPLSMGTTPAEIIAAYIQQGNATVTSKVGETVKIDGGDENDAKLP